MKLYKIEEEHGQRREERMMWELFLTFTKIGFISFGGGYAMIPIIEYEVLNHGWLDAQQFTDVISIAGMSPGPIATNSAVFVGYKIAGIPGAIVATFAISLPSLILILLVALFFYKIQKHKLVQSIFYGLRPVIVGLICYAAVRFSIYNGIIGGDYLFNGVSIMILLFSLSILLFTRIHPLVVIFLSGIVGIMIY